MTDCRRQAGGRFAHPVAGGRVARSRRSVKSVQIISCCVCKILSSTFATVSIDISHAGNRCIKRANFVQLTGVALLPVELLAVGLSVQSVQIISNRA